MGYTGELHTMLSNGATVQEIADWLFSLKVSRGHDINENTKEDCFVTLNTFTHSFITGVGFDA